MGAHFKKQEIWPFGQGYYASLKNIKNYGFNLKEILAEEEKIAERRREQTTTLHNLMIDKVDVGFDHIAIYNEIGDSVTLIGIKGIGTQEKIRLEVYKIVINTEDKKIQSNDLIFEDVNNFRANDVLITNDKNIFISYASSDEKGFLKLKVVKLVNLNNMYESKLVYQTQSYPPPFGVHQTGGKMAEYDENTILLAVGDFQKGNFIDDDNNEVGKTLLINKHLNNTKKVFTTGHRNIQGLAYSNFLEKFIATEHGPQGGDILIQIKEIQT